MKKAVYAVFVVLIGVVSIAWAAQPDRITSAINGSQIVVIKGSVYGRALPQYDQGRVDPAMKLDYITLQIVPSPAQQAALNKLLAAQQDPTSKSYHQWLTPEQFGAQFGLSSSDVARITNWLRSQGFTVLQTARSRNWIAFSGTAAQVEATFHTQIHHFNVEGEQHFANATDISLPKALVGVVTTVNGLHDFLWKPFYVHRHTAGLMNPDYSTGGNNFLAPDDIGTIYDIKPLIAAGYDGTGMNLVIIGQSDIVTSDITQFRSGFHLPAINFTKVVAGGTTGCVNPGPVSGDEGESDLDLEWVGAVAQNANIIFDICDSNHGGVFTALQDAVTNNRGQVISLSYGGCEPSWTLGSAQSVQSMIQQANAEGITFMSSSGDSGAAACDQGSTPPATQGLAVNVPASIPETTAVGGSEFNEGSGTYWGSNGPNYGSALSYIPEEGWNDTSPLGFASGGGGKSIYFSKPSWQTGTGVPNDNARDVPDVAITASADHDGYMLCSSDPEFGYPGGSCATSFPNTNVIIGGTSASSPVFAGIVTLLNQYLVKNGKITKPGLGNINVQLYPFAANNSTAFHDITQGNNIQPCQQGTTGCPTSAPFQYGYSAGVGYDQVTGLGSVDAYNFVTGWGGALRPSTTTVSVSPTAVNYPGTTVTVTATVKPTSGSGTPTGTVTFYNGTTQIGTGTLSSDSAQLSYDVSKLSYSTNNGVYSLTATYGGDTTFAGSTSTTPATLDVQYFTLTATNATISSPGQQGTSTVTITPYGNLSASSLSFTCLTGLPSESNCSAGAVANNQVTLTITSTAASDLFWPQFGRHQQLFYALLLPGFLGVVSLGGRKRTLRSLQLLALITLLALPALWLACGGGGGGGGNHNPGTPTGTYTVTVTGTTTGTTALQNTTTFTLTVQ